MQARARLVRTRSAIRHWEYRQRHLAAGVWFRLRRVLADASAAYAIAEEDAYRLGAEGYVSEACGAELPVVQEQHSVRTRRKPSEGRRLSCSTLKRRKRERMVYGSGGNAASTA
jgi:hypothetical protein